MRKTYFQSIWFFLSMAVALIPAAVLAEASTSNDYFQTAAAQYQQNKINESIASLKQAVEMDPSNWKAYQLMGNAYIKLNQPHPALAAYDQCLRLNPNFPALKDYVDKLRASLPPEPLESLPGLSAPAAAPAKGPKGSLYLFGGAGLPLYPTNFSNSRTLGYSGGFGYGLEVSPSFSFVFEAFENYFSFNTAQYPNLAITGGEVGDALLMVNGKIGFVPSKESFVPYGIVGFGLSLFTSNLITAVDPAAQTLATTPAASETGFGYRLGLGFEMRMAEGTAFFLDVNGFGTTGVYSMLYSQARAGVKLNL